MVHIWAVHKNNCFRCKGRVTKKGATGHLFFHFCKKEKVFPKKWILFSYPPKKPSSTLPSSLVTHLMRMVFPESRISLQPFSADRVSQRWTVVGSKLQNGPDNPNWVIGLADDTAQSGAYPKAMTYQGNNNQHWAVEYV